MYIASKTATNGSSEVKCGRKMEEKAMDYNFKGGQKYHGMAHLQDADGGDSLQILRVAPNILN
jgi:hypothetical protein